MATRTFWAFWAPPSTNPTGKGEGYHTTFNDISWLSKQIELLLNNGEPRRLAENPEYSLGSHLVIPCPMAKVTEKPQQLRAVSTTKGTDSSRAGIWVIPPGKELWAAQGLDKRKAKMPRGIWNGWWKKITNTNGGLITSRMNRGCHNYVYPSVVIYIFVHFYIYIFIFYIYIFVHLYICIFLPIFFPTHHAIIILYVLWCVFNFTI